MDEIEDRLESTESPIDAEPDGSGDGEVVESAQEIPQTIEVPEPSVAIAPSPVLSTQAMELHARLAGNCAMITAPEDIQSAVSVMMRGDVLCVDRAIRHDNLRAAAQAHGMYYYRKL